MYWDEFLTIQSKLYTVQYKYRLYKAMRDGTPNEWSASSEIYVALIVISSKMNSHSAIPENYLFGFVSKDRNIIRFWNMQSSTFFVT